jgi:hypothetical protein
MPAKAPKGFYVQVDESRAFRLISRFVVLVVFGTAMTLGTGNAGAAPCKKNINVKDVGDASTPTSGQLRTAIVEVCSGGTIHLPASGVIDLNQGELVIPAGKVLTILTASQNKPATIDANGAGRVIWVQVNASLTLRNVIVQGGEVGINNDGSLTVTDGAVRDNTGVGIVNNETGLVTLSGDTLVAANDFSGVFNLGDLFNPPVSQLTLEDDATISGNAGVNGGGIFNTGGTVTLNDQSSVSGNTAAFGGGIYAGIGLVTLNDESSIYDNEATEEGGGIYNPAGSPIASNVLNDRSRITGNVGGGIGGRGYVTLNDDSTVAANTGTGIDNVRGGVILNNRSSVAGNHGAGVSAFGVGVTMNDQSRISNNEGGGIGVFDASAVLNDESAVIGNDVVGVAVSFGALTLNSSSSISGNTTQGDGGGVALDEGNLVLNDDSSITGNIGRFGGGIYNANFPVDPSECPSLCITLNGSSTITENVATGGAGGGIYNANGGTVLVNDLSSITGNTPDDCFPLGSC